MSPRILLLLAGAAALSVAFNPDRMEAAMVSSEAGNVPYKYGCKYRVSSVWNDIIFLIDRSGSYMENLHRFVEKLYYTMSQIMQPFTVTKIGSMNKAQVRFGFTLFNSYNTIGGTFGQSLLTDIPNVNTYRYYEPDDKMANIDIALQSAQARFSKSDRPNASKVIVLMTQTLMHNSSVADGLKKMGYIINVYTNCFCDPKSDSFTTDNSTGVPTGGCYGMPKPALASYPSGVNLCARSYHGVIALDKTQEKTNFLNKELRGTTNYYIGSKWSDDYLVWLGEDGTMLSRGDFDLLPNKVIPSATGDNKCVYQDPTKNQWILTVAEIQ